MGWAGAAACQHAPPRATPPSSCPTPAASLRRAATQLLSQPCHHGHPSRRTMLVLSSALMRLQFCAPRSTSSSNRALAAAQGKESQSNTRAGGVVGGAAMRTAALRQ